MRSIALVMALTMAGWIGLSGPAISQGDAHHGQAPDQQQAVPGTMNEMMQRCRQAHGAMTGAVDKALAAVRAARSSNDPRRLQDALAEVERLLVPVQGQMATCSMMMEGMVGCCGAMGDGMMRDRR